MQTCACVKTSSVPLQVSSAMHLQPSLNSPTQRTYISELLICSRFCAACQALFG